MISPVQQQIITEAGFEYKFCINPLAAIVVKASTGQAYLLNFNNKMDGITQCSKVYACMNSRQFFMTEDRYNEYIASCNMLNNYHSKQ